MLPLKVKIKKIIKLFVRFRKTKRNYLCHYIANTKLILNKSIINIK